MNDTGVCRTALAIPGLLTPLVKDLWRETDQPGHTAFGSNIYIKYIEHIKLIKHIDHKDHIKYI